jgi:hypothetical protein
VSVGPLSPVSPQRMTTPGSLTSLMNALVAIQAEVPGELEGFPELLTCYRWKPDQADLPALYNWLLPSTNEMRDLSRIRDSINITTRIVVGMQDTLEDKMPFVEAAADAYRAILDSNFWDGMRTPQSGMGAAVTWAARSSMQSCVDTLGTVQVTGIEITQAFWADRHIR